MEIFGFIISKKVNQETTSMIHEIQNFNGNLIFGLQSNDECSVYSKVKNKKNSRRSSRTGLYRQADDGNRRRVLRGKKNLDLILCGVPP